MKKARRWKLIIALLIFIAAVVFLRMFFITDTGASRKVDDASNFTSLGDGGGQIVRTSRGVLYTALNQVGSCEIWKSTDGSTWAEQDSADNPACNATIANSPVAIAIDATDVIHMTYRDDSASTLFYITFNTNTDQFGSEESTTIALFATTNSAAIAIDSNNIPHIATSSSSNAKYTNRVGGSWDVTPSTPITGNIFAIDIAISDENIPEIAGVVTGDTDIDAALGNQNDATSFSTQIIEPNANVSGGERGVSIGIDSSGNTWVAYITLSGNVSLIKHNDADDWTTWQTAVSNSSPGNEPSLAINGTDVYIFYEDSADDDIKYDMYNGSWLGEQTLETGTFVDAKVRWSFLNNPAYTTFGFDYLYSDGTDVYYDRLIIPGPAKIDDAGNPGVMDGRGRTVVRNSSGTLYAFFNDGGSCEIWSSTDGSSWTEQDDVDNPTCLSGADVALAIDGTNVLHMIYESSGGNDLMYKTFDTSSSQFGSEETVSTSDPSFVDLAIDSNNIPHVAFISGQPYYDNRVGGSWGADVDTGTVTVSISITINEDNIPELTYISTSALIASVGNQNDASSFTEQTVDATVNSTDGTRGSTIAVDSSGNTWIAYADTTGTNQITLIKHNDADAWSSWQTPVTNSNVGNEPSIAIVGSDIYVFYEDSADDDIKFDMYNGSVWWGETLLQQGTYQDAKVKNSTYFNNQPSNQLDYLFSDGTDIFYDSMNFVETEAVGDWYDTDWLYRKQITIDRTKVAGNQTDFPVLIRLNSDADLAAEAKSDGFDILFTSSDGTTKLSHDREEFDEATGELTAWVKVPTLSSALDTVLYMYYGNSGSCDQAASACDATNYAADVWSSYISVHHMTGTSGSATLPDATSPANNGAKLSGTSDGEPTNYSAGKISAAQDFDGSNDYVTIADDDVYTFTYTNNYSWSFWINPDDFEAWNAVWFQGTSPAITEISIFAHTDGADANFGPVTEGIAVGIHSSSGNAIFAHTSNNVLSVGNWSYVTVTYDASQAEAARIKIYVDGVDRTSVDVAEPGTLASMNPTKMYIGWDDTATEFEDGKIDEFRYISALRSSTWVATEYNNQHSPQAFYNIGSEEAGGSPEPTPTPIPVINIRGGNIFRGGVIFR